MKLLRQWRWIVLWTLVAAIMGMCVDQLSRTVR
jgi:hypothetical protein